MLAALLLVTLRSAHGDDFFERCPSPLTRSPRDDGPVTAMSSAEIVEISESTVRGQACAFENHQIIQVTLEVRQAKRIAVTAGQRVMPGTVLASAGHLFIDGMPPRRFFDAHPNLYDPWKEPILILVDVDGHDARRYEYGHLTGRWEVGQGQMPGEKQRRGDLKTPRGLYFVIEKSTGPFSGPVAEYYGGHWIKVNYPNAFDGIRGVNEGLIGTDQAQRIATEWKRRALTLQNTKLGGGIGFHGWVTPWNGPRDGYALSWGCVVLQPEEVADFYSKVPLGAAVVLR